MVQRCQWIQDKPDFYVAYHDTVWGKPCYNDRELFQWLTLEVFHSGLSWQLVLSKLDDFQQAFDGLDPEKISQYTACDVERLMNNPKIIRHRRKIEATIQNAQSFLAIKEEWGSFSRYIWHFTQNKPVIRKDGEAMQTRSALSDQVTQDMKQKGFKFIGSTTIHSYLQGIGVINDHDETCLFK
ncbi:DNA-3-methyladenine glycosylase I [Dolosicoccus paucivorans]|uniref:DNA-3-methyladenine glycosylase I n=1 Tax=Dolosicoccus paucivorans TaxID=84521 RepID=A0A1G8KV12_9LACT|nr:DNA-3-methyladenine glycosylase I [Dolosicoccus paucivorans]PMB83982.1 DNA-3-methyladenine glycosylase I [Dolosicoccus paucivorans]PMC58262.1 DNA-3-methyladenine glycosylase I [Dolosicoccus paucivorans]SDI47355.1 DNA-3-methyladenine glycosylase I [Dolosicoccus paucivorans]